MVGTLELAGAYGENCHHGYELDIPLNQSELADLVGASRPVVSTILNKLINSYTVRNTQAKELKSLINKSPYPSVLCGDIDDVPNSTTYFTIKESLQDAFVKKGVWPGATFRFISPTLRIDYIFAHRDFNVIQFITKKEIYSDHLPLITDLQFKN